MKHFRSDNTVWLKPPEAKRFLLKKKKITFFSMSFFCDCAVLSCFSYDKILIKAVHVLSVFYILSVSTGNITQWYKKLENEQKRKGRTYGMERKGLGFPFASILPTTLTVGNTRQHSIWHFLSSPTDSGKQYVLQLKHTLPCQTLMATSATFRKTGFPNRWAA